MSKRKMMRKSLIVIHPILIHKTSISIEDAFGKGLKKIARDRDMTFSRSVALSDGQGRSSRNRAPIRRSSSVVIRRRRCFLPCFPASGFARLAATTCSSNGSAMRARRTVRAHGNAGPGPKFERRVPRVRGSFRGLADHVMTCARSGPWTPGPHQPLLQGSTVA